MRKIIDFSLFVFRFSFLTCLACIVAMTAKGQDPYAADRNRWLRIAEEAKPQLHETIVKPKTVVKAVKDPKAYQGWRYEPTTGLDSLYTKNFKEVKSVTLDFGKHLTGYFSFQTKTLNRCQDAPVRIKFTFGEAPAELNTPLDPWQGTLSRAWMQDEVVTVEEMDKPVTIARRMAFRYLKIELMGASPDFDFAIDDLQFRAVSSAGEVKTSLLDGCSQAIKNINNVGIETLRECMQTVYEDGPKRDRRLWIGDLYLESLANRYSFRNLELTKRCLYIFAALSAPDGVLISNVFERPTLHPQYGSYCLTYCLLYNSALLEYLKDTGDTTTANDLWQVARRQVEDALSYLDGDYIFNQNKRGSYVWLFFDWRDELDVNTPMQGAVLFALNQTMELAHLLGRDNEVEEWKSVAAKMKDAARNRLYDKQEGVFTSGANKQVSALSQAWMIIGGALSKKDGQKALRTALASSETLMPGTPYATHYLIEAMLRCGMTAEARQYLESYWGGMVAKGADTFWEAYDPNDDYISPYRFFPVNSTCHAWSCTPVYFIHKYPEVFQK